MSSSNVIVSTSHGPMIVNLHDKYIGRCIIDTGYWAQGDIEVICKLLQHRLQTVDKVTFYDVGANIGTHTLALAKMLPGVVKIRSFEAQAEMFRILCGNVAINNLANVSCHHQAVSRRSGYEISFRVPDYTVPNNFGGLELIKARQSDNADMVMGHKESVPTVSLDSFDEPIDLIKLDIEGMEDKALQGATRLFRKYRPFVCAEVFKTDRDFVMTFFRKRNYTAWQMNVDMVFQPRESTVELVGLTPVF